MSNNSNSTINSVEIDEDDAKYAVDICSLDDGIEQDLDVNINLISMEGKSFTITKRQAFLSSLIKTACCGDQTATDVELNVNSEILSLVVEYLVNCNGVASKNIIQPLPLNHKFRELTTEFNSNFLYKVAGCPETEEPPKSTTKSRLFALISAADYMQINCLLYLVGAWLASMAKLSKLEDIPDVIRIESDPFDESRVDQYRQYLNNLDRDKLIFFLNPLEDPAQDNLKDLSQDQLVNLSLDLMRKKNISLI